MIYDRKDAEPGKEIAGGLESRSKGYVPDDEIAKRAYHVLAWNSVFPCNAIQLTVHEGWITLSGELEWQYQKEAAKCCKAVARRGRRYQQYFGQAAHRRQGRKAEHRERPEIQCRTGSESNQRRRWRWRHGYP